MKLEVEFSTHSLEQLGNRPGITKSMVLDAIKNADQIAQSYRGRELYRKRYGNEWLEIVTAKEDNKLIVITQYFLET